MNEVKKFFSGNYGLFKTYWQITIPLFIAIGLAGKLIGLKPKETMTIVWVAIYFGAIFATTIALWNASSKFKGKMIWSALVKIQCVLTVLPFILAVMFSSGVELNKIFTSQSETNKGNLNNETKSNDVGNTKVAFYETSIHRDCSSPYKTKPLVIEEFIVDIANKKVISKYETDTGEKGIKEKIDCIVIDKKNWTCGGSARSGPFGGTFAKATVIDGDFTYTPAVDPHFPPSCPPKIEILN